MQALSHHLNPDQEGNGAGASLGGARTARGVAVGEEVAGILALGPNFVVMWPVGINFLPMLQQLAARGCPGQCFCMMQ